MVEVAEVAFHGFAVRFWGEEAWKIGDCEENGHAEEQSLW